MTNPQKCGTTACKPAEDTYRKIAEKPVYKKTEDKSTQHTQTRTATHEGNAR
jgi:hypothetical protein